MGAERTSRWRAAVAGQAVGLARTLALGYVLFFWSERAFWSFLRPGDEVRDLAMTWIAYSLLAAIAMALARTYRAATQGAVFLVGAVYGWLAEGAIVDTLYGGSDNPFPLSISWTGLAWHALLTVGLGWVWTGTALKARNARAIAGRSAALGAGWGFWAVWWPNEAGASFSTTPSAFAVHALGFGVPLAAAWWVLGRLPAPAGAPSLRERVALLLLVAAFLTLVRIPATPAAGVLLLPLLSLCWWGLRRLAPGEPAPDLVARTTGGFGAREAALALATPAAAVAVYGSLAWTRLPANVALYLVTTPLGFWMLGRALWRAARRSPSAAV